MSKLYEAQQALDYSRQFYVLTKIYLDELIGNQ